MQFEKWTSPRQAAEQILRQLNLPEMFAHQRKILMESIMDACAHFSNEALERQRKLDHVEDVTLFMLACKQHIGETPGFPPEDVLKLRIRLIAEEFCELLAACGFAYDVGVAARSPMAAEYVYLFSKEEDRRQVDFPAAVDALTDLGYVIHGTSLAFGVNPQPIWEAVHAANMTNAGSPIVNGKITKPEGFKPPDVAALLKEQGWEP